MNRRSVLVLLANLHLFASASGQELDLRVPRPDFSFIDQTQGAGDACGPVSLLNSFGSGSQDYRLIYNRIPGPSDRARIGTVIKSWGRKPSQKFPTRERWQKRRGVSFEDLTAMSSEMASMQWGLSKPRGKLLFLDHNRKDRRLFKTTHKRLAKSLHKGFPPVLSVRRFVFRQGYWQSVHGHFVTLVAMPSKLPRGGQTFRIRLLDPLGAEELAATISMPKATEATEAGFPCFIIDAPGNRIGTAEVKRGEVSHLALAGLIGVW